MPGYESASDFCKLPWSYNDQASWNDLPGSKCGHVGDQAPIALDTATIKDNTSEEGEYRLRPPQWVEGTEKLGVVQTPDRHEWGFDTIGGQAGITWNGKLYNLTNFHLHSPSEHTLDIQDGAGPQRFPAEMHFVNTASDGEILVVALLYTVGILATDTDEELAKLAYDIGAVRQGDIPINNTVKQIVNNPYHWPLTRYHINTYYTYQGSLTTPPCQTGVTWMVMKQTRTMNEFQLSQYRGAMQSASCDSLPSSQRWVDPHHGNDRGAPPNCNGAVRKYAPNATNPANADGSWHVVPGADDSYNNEGLPNCNPTPTREHCSLLAQIPVLGGWLPKVPFCTFAAQHQSWMPYAKWNYSSACGENNRDLQPRHDRPVYAYVTPTPMSLQILETIFVITVSYIFWSIYWDRVKKQLIIDRSLKEWYLQIGRELPQATKDRIDRADARDVAEAARVAALPAQPAQQVNAREPDAGSNVMVAPSDASSQPLLQG